MPLVPHAAPPALLSTSRHHDRSKGVDRRRHPLSTPATRAPLPEPKLMPPLLPLPPHGGLRLRPLLPLFWPCLTVPLPPWCRRSSSPTAVGPHRRGASRAASALPPQVEPLPRYAHHPLLSPAPSPETLDAHPATSPRRPQARWQRTTYAPCHGPIWLVFAMGWAAKPRPWTSFGPTLFFRFPFFQIYFLI
jgi:hypothetical protein